MKKNQSVIMGIVIGVVFVVSIVLWYFSPRWFDNSDYPYYGHMIGSWGMPFGMLAMSIFWIAVIYFVFNGFHIRQENSQHRAIESLKNRLAKGEITIDEYEKLLEKIRD